MAIGKDYKKGDPLRGAAILVLTMELMGKGPKGTDVLLQDTFTDLGVTEKQVRRYVRKHRAQLIEELKEQGIGK